MSKTSKIFCMQCNGVKCIHVEDICMECNPMYSRLNNMHVKDVEDDTNTHNVVL